MKREFGYPAGNVFYRKLTRSYPRVVRADGCYLYDDAGRRYLDACGGAFVANLGHGVSAISQAISRQSATVSYVNGTAFTNDAVEELASEIAGRCPGDLDKVYFLTSGSEATEAALKLARQYWVESGKPDKQKIIALAPGYHGSTLLALSASARAHYRAIFREWLVDVRTIPAPYAYRCPCRGGDEDCPTCSAQVLEDAIILEGASTVAAFIAEPVGGSSTGASVPRPDYFRRVRDICSRHDVLFIADEVLTGAGRTGTWSALEPYGVVPDIMTLGKGIAGGYVPLSAVVAPARVVDVLARGTGWLMHAQTFSHHPVLCAAGLACLRYLDEYALIERCARMGHVLHQQLGALTDHRTVGDVRGRGLLAGVEFVADKQTRSPLPRRMKFAETFTECAQEAGLVVWPNVGHAGGTNGDLVMLAPPFVVAENEIEEIVRLFGIALESTLNRCFKG